MVIRMIKGAIFDMDGTLLDMRTGEALGGSLLDEYARGRALCKRKVRAYGG